MKKSLVLAMLFACNSAFALSVKHNKAAARGCIPRISQAEAQAAIKRFNLTTQNAKPEEIRALGTGLVWIEKLNGGRPLPEAVAKGSPYAFIFKDGNGHSRQTGGGIILKRNGAKNYSTNVAQLVHELGHLVGNQGGYGQYRKYVGTKPCVVSSYSASKFNEQFAEVFAAFVTYPELIENNDSKACQMAFQFFSRAMFDNGNLAKTCDQ